jgi:hypothetical protein
MKQCASYNQKSAADDQIPTVPTKKTARKEQSQPANEEEQQPTGDSPELSGHRSTDINAIK